MLKMLILSIITCASLWLQLEASKTQPSLYIGILSAPQYKNRREAIRRTWLKAATAPRYVDRIRYEFLVASTPNQALQLELANEQQEHRDMVLFTWPDSYRRLQIKIREALRRAFVGNRETMDFLLKVDDDSFVQVELVMNALETFSPWLYGGYFLKEQLVIRNKRNPMYMKEAMFPDTTYPSFAVGAGYIIGKELGQLLVSKMDQLRIWPLEDVGMALWIDQVGGDLVNRTHLNNIAINKSCSRLDMIVHHSSPNRMVCMWKRRHLDDICCPWELGKFQADS